MGHLYNNFEHMLGKISGGDVDVVDPIKPGDDGGGHEDGGFLQEIERICAKIMDEFITSRRDVLSGCGSGSGSGRKVWEFLNNKKYANVNQGCSTLWGYSGGMMFETPEEAKEYGDKKFTPGYHEHKLNAIDVNGNDDEPVKYRASHSGGGFLEVIEDTEAAEGTTIFMAGENHDIASYVAAAGYPKTASEKTTIGTIYNWSTRFYFTPQDEQDGGGCGDGGGGDPPRPKPRVEIEDPKNYKPNTGIDPKRDLDGRSEVKETGNTIQGY